MHVIEMTDVQHSCRLRGLDCKNVFKKKFKIVNSELKKISHTHNSSYTEKIDFHLSSYNKISPSVTS